MKVGGPSEFEENDFKFLRFSLEYAYRSVSWRDRRAGKWRASNFFLGIDDDEGLKDEE